jgi:hypothetical protein
MRGASVQRCMLGFACRWERTWIEPLTEAMHIHDSNESNSCCLKSRLAVEGNSSPRKTKSAKTLHPTLQQ